MSVTVTHHLHPEVARSEPLHSLLPALIAWPDPAALCSMEGAILAVNSAWEERFEAKAAVFQGQSSGLVVGPYSEQNDGRQLLDLVRTGEGLLETTAFTNSGRAFPALVRVRRVDSGHGSEARLLVVNDQTNQHRLRAELALRGETIQRERDMLRATTEAMAQGVIIADDGERVLLVNSTARELTGLGPNDGPGRLVSELALPGSIRGAWLIFLASPQSESLQTIRVQFAGAARTFLLRFVRLRSHRGVPVASVLVLRDLTSHVEPDRRKNHLVVQLSGELRTPLTSARGYVETLLTNPDLDRDLRIDFVRSAHTEIDRLVDVVERLLEIGQLDAGALILERRETDLVAIVRHAIDKQRGLAIVADLPATPIMAFVDAPRLQLTVQHLLTNAALHGRSEQGIRLQLGVEGQFVRLSVRDFGPGVPPEHLERIFDPFHRVIGPTNQGSDPRSGLGLTLCRQVVERHGGELRAELPAGGGLRLVLDLPISTQ